VDVFYRAFGDRVRDARRGRYTQTELGRLVGLSRASIANIETGRQHIPLHMLEVFARELAVAPCDLLPAKPIGAQADVPADRLIRLHPEDQDAVQRLVSTARKQRRVSDGQA
jgi:transcriptional regulator with XRE-family HTH domain